VEEAGVEDPPALLYEPHLDDALPVVREF